MTTIMKKQGKQTLHPHVEELKYQYSKGAITRRQFLRNATLLGMSAAAVASFAPALFPSVARAGQPKRGGLGNTL